MNKMVLVNIDLHQADNGFIYKAAQIAQDTGASLELFCSCFNPALHNAYPFDEQAEHEGQRGYLHKVEAALEKMAEPLREEGLEVGTDLVWHRDPAEAVIRKAQRYMPDMVVHFFAADRVSWHLVRDCPFPLLLAGSNRWHEPMNIAAAVDPFHDCDHPAALDRRILDQVAHLGRAMLAKTHAVHSFHTLPHSAIFDEHVVTDYRALQRKVRTDHDQALEHLLDGYRLEEAEFKLHLLEGEPHQVLPRFVIEEQIDILVAGAVARGFLDRLLLGSTVERIIPKVDADVLVVKPAGFRSPYGEG